MTSASVESTGSGEWRLYEVFVRARRGLSHHHVGSVHAPDAQMALRNARDLYTRREEGVPAGDKVYRHPAFYDLPDGVQM